MTIHRPYPYLAFRCRVSDRTFEELAYVDTGFSGGMVIPESERKGLSEPLAYIPIELGDASHTIGAEYVGNVLIGESEFQVTVLFLGGEYLIGREIIDQMRICFHHGQYLEIET